MFNSSLGLKHAEWAAEAGEEAGSHIRNDLSGLLEQDGSVSQGRDRGEKGGMEICFNNNKGQHLPVLSVSWHHTLMVLYKVSHLILN